MVFIVWPLGHLLLLHTSWGPWSHISVCVAASDSIQPSTSRSRIHPHLSRGIQVPLPHSSPISPGVGAVVQAVVPVWEWVPLGAVVVEVGSPASGRMNDL